MFADYFVHFASQKVLELHNALEGRNRGAHEPELFRMAPVGANPDALCVFSIENIANVAREQQLNGRYYGSVEGLCAWRIKEAEPFQRLYAFHDLLLGDLVVLCHYLLSSDTACIVRSLRVPQIQTRKLRLGCTEDFIHCPGFFLLVCDQHVAPKTALPSDGHDKHSQGPLVHKPFPYQHGPASRLDSRPHKVEKLVYSGLDGPPHTATNRSGLLGTPYHNPGAFEC